MRADGGQRDVETMPVAAIGNWPPNAVLERVGRRASCAAVLRDSIFETSFVGATPAPLDATSMPSTRLACAAAQFQHQSAVQPRCPARSPCC